MTRVKWIVAFFLAVLVTSCGVSSTSEQPNGWWAFAPETRYPTTAQIRGFLAAEKCVGGRKDQRAVDAEEVWWIAVDSIVPDPGNPAPQWHRPRAVSQVPNTIFTVRGHERDQYLAMHEALHLVLFLQMGAEEHEHPWFLACDPLRGRQ